MCICDWRVGKVNKIYNIVTIANMKKSEMFSVLIDKVCEVCEVQREDIINGCKIQSVVDARVLLVQYLRRTGLSSDEIAEIVLRNRGQSPTVQEVKKKAKGIDKLYYSYLDRVEQSFAFGLMAVEIKRFCRDYYGEQYVPGMKQLSS